MSHIYSASIGLKCLTLYFFLTPCCGTKPFLIFVLLLPMEIRAQRDQSVSPSKGENKDRRQNRGRSDDIRSVFQTTDV